MRKYFFLLTLSSLLAASSLYSSSPVDTHGALAVTGNRIVGAKDNQPVQVAGMSLYWSIWGGEKYYNRQVVEWLIKDWNITLIRCAMAIESNNTTGMKGYLADPEGQKNLVKAVVDAAIDAGIYVIVDWHDHNANLNVNQAKAFFSEMAQTYAGVPNIIWEIWNEPEDKNGTGAKNVDTWDDVKNYANQVIPVIREYSSNLIVVGTPTWSQDVDVAAESPLSGTNIAYALHFYAGTHKAYLRAKAETALDAGAALFITEFGLSTADGGKVNKTVFTDSGRVWLDWADQKGISWANWSIVDFSETSAALVPGAPPNGNWSTENISQSGQWMRERLKARKVYDSNPVTSDTIRIPGKIEAEEFISKSTELQAEVTSDAGSGQNLGYAVHGSWAEYIVKVNQSGPYTAQLRVATESSGGTLTLKVNGASVATWEVGSTGGWQTWTTTGLSPVFQLQQGAATVRIEWSGSGTSLVNLNWIQFQPGTSVRHCLLKKYGNRIDAIISRPGSISMNLSDDVKKVSVFTLSDSLLYSFPALSTKITIPLGKGLHLLKIENRDGNTISMPIAGY